MRSRDRKKRKKMNKHARRRRVFTFKNDDDYKNGVKKINRGKNGRPFDFPDELFIFLFIWRIINGVSYRGLEGVIGSSDNLDDDRPSFQTIHRRINRLRPDIRLGGKVTIEDDIMDIAMDGTAWCRQSAANIWT